MFRFHVKARGDIMAAAAIGICLGQAVREALGRQSGARLVVNLLEQ